MWSTTPSLDRLVSLVGSRKRNDAEELLEDTDTSTVLIVLPTSSKRGRRSFTRFSLGALVAGMVILLSPLAFSYRSQPSVDPTDYVERPSGVLQEGVSYQSLIDGHNDLPYQFRIELHNRIKNGPIDVSKRLLGHTDLIRMREGKVRGHFSGASFSTAMLRSNIIETHRDTLEQIDMVKRFIQGNPKDLAFCDLTYCGREAFKNGRIASMIGIQEGHQVGGSIANIRQIYELGVGYMILTHNCDNASATSATVVVNGGPDRGLTDLGRVAVREMNRLGMVVDLSHVSHRTMDDVLAISRAPVIFSHSGTYSVNPQLRNVPDYILRSLNRNGGIIMAVFMNQFLEGDDPTSATIHDVADHVFHISDICGWSCVGIGRDFSGALHMPRGLEDVSKFPNLIQFLMKRGATDDQMRKFAGNNILPVWGDVGRRAAEIQASGEKPMEDEDDGRWWHDMESANSPWIMRGSREKSLAMGFVDE